MIRRTFEVGSNDGCVTIDGMGTTTLVLEKGESYAFMQGGPGNNPVILVGRMEGGVVYPNNENVKYYKHLPETGAFEVELAVFQATMEQGGRGYYIVQVPIEGTMVLYVTAVLGYEPVIVTTIEPIPRIQTGDYVWVEMQVDERLSTNSGADWTEWKSVDELQGCSDGLCSRLILSINLIPDESVSGVSLSETT